MGYYVYENAIHGSAGTCKNINDLKRMEIKIYKTHEINDNIWTQIVEGFNLSFEGHHTTKEKMIIHYTSNEFGFSYHAICSDGDKLAGFNSIIPHYYIYNNKEKIILGLSGTTYVLKEYRKDIFIFYDMFNSLKEYCSNENIVAFIGVPNSNSYEYFIKFLESKEISKLPYYILPLNFFNVIGKRSLSCLNFISYLFVYVWLIINTLFSLVYNSKEHTVSYKLDINDNFCNKRFSASKYKTIRRKNKKSTYVIVEENGIRTAYIMDFRENTLKQYKVLIWSVRQILKHEKVDVIIFVGTMNFKQYLFFKVPPKFEPQKLPLIYNMLKNTFQDRYSDMAVFKNWDFSLINLDVR
jgi:hypothetical protein